MKEAADQPPRERHLIEFGWDEPDPAFMAEHRREMEETPFDGCVFHATYPGPDGKLGNFTWECWGRKEFSEKDLGEGLKQMREAGFSRFDHNFLRFNVTPGDLDWFDDFSAVVSNAGLAARFARDAGCPGILFDIEQYTSRLFDYEEQKHTGTRGWKGYARQVGKWGEEIMDAFQDAFPGITIFLTFGYSLPWKQMGGTKSLKEVGYGLLAPLLDGMVRAASGSTTMVDGHELSYSYKDIGRFPEAYRTMSEDLLEIVEDPEKYRRIFSLAFGLWLDCDWKKIGWHTTELDRNYYSPDEFGRSLSEALKTSDRYVWIYSESPRWWTPEGGSKDLPGEYVAAIERAMAPCRSGS